MKKNSRKITPNNGLLKLFGKVSMTKKIRVRVPLETYKAHFTDLKIRRCLRRQKIGFNSDISAFFFNGIFLTLDSWQFGEEDEPLHPESQVGPEPQRVPQVCQAREGRVCHLTCSIVVFPHKRFFWVPFELLHKMGHISKSQLPSFTACC